MSSDFISRKNGRRQRRTTYRPMSEINVTPFVDVMLVLLIVFMITAPLLTVGVPVDLPKTKAQLLSQPEEPLVISVNAKGEIYVQETSVPLESLVPRLIAITENNADTRIYLRGDRSIDYGRMMQVMGYVNAAGFRRVALIAELPDANEDAADKDDDRNG
jgi:biopolymer transport protein TolR